MPDAPKKNVSLYRDEQVDAYQDARDQLAACDVDVDSLSEGDVLAALSREYVDAVEADRERDLGSTAGASTGFWGAAGLFGPVIVLVFWCLCIGAFAVLYLT